MPLTLDFDNYVFRDRWNDCQARRATMTGPTSYDTGGVAIANLGDFGWGETHTLQGVLENGSAVRLLWLDRANQKVKIYVPNTGAEVAAAVDLSAFTGEIVATGK